PTRNHVRAIKVALPSGEIVELRRPPVLEKNTVGYKIVHDPVDWFVGSEGTLGVVLEVEFGLLPKPERIVGLAFPFPDEQAALAFVAEARTARDITVSGGAQTVNPRCLEFFCPVTAAIFDGRFEEEAVAAPRVYTEETMRADEEPPFEQWLALAEKHGVVDADIEVFDNDAALRDARKRRHDIPAVMQERGNRYMSVGGRRVSTDWSVPYRRLGEVVAMVHRMADEANIPHPVSFGHAGNGHPHQNYVCPTPEEVRRADAVVGETLKHVIAMGGTAAAEHGIGKVKRHWIGLQLTPLQIRMMAAVKKELDPLGLMAPGNVF
ncbi:MAG TPA: FAD-binding oxidoreductase, partial [Longimicrobiales bacterium]